MSKALFLAVGLALLMIPSAAFSAGDDPILEFDTMVGVTGPFVGAANPIRNIGGGGAPWRIDRGEGKLESDGDLKVVVEGLTLLSGVNPQAAFRAAVSCLTITAGAPDTVNVVTAGFPATSTGDATIEANVVLPSPCIAPIIFVGTGSMTFRWFSVTGF